LRLSNFSFGVKELKLSQTEQISDYAQASVKIKEVLTNRRFTLTLSKINVKKNY